MLHMGVTDFNVLETSGFFRGGPMHSGKRVFAQLMEHLPLATFRRCVARYPGKYPTLTCSHLDPYLCMVFSPRTPTTCANGKRRRIRTGFLPPFSIERLSSTVTLGE